nr:MAG TPA: hypothetical protein [Caudoviricetes sp.]DAT12309.1 MAG TPA: hypothetical protein [Crassvirales sp.]DAK58795.1 MAG TPA: hypothetical protein [Caudoviricetes sp.]DAL68708.1 MAG TPA: hypothetical protein [Caudoviricetes sp.]DAV43052.1 MAG TPA: hypothetical protein [Caudoviricetes sp.]
MLLVRRKIPIFATYLIVYTNKHAKGESNCWINKHKPSLNNSN